MREIVPKTCRNWLVTGSIVGLTLLASSCNSSGQGNRQPSVLDPYGPGAAQIANLWWLMFWLGLAVLVLVFVLVLYASFARPRGDDLALPAPPGNRLIIWGGIALPVPVLALVLGYTMYTSNVTTLPSAGWPTFADTEGRAANRTTETEWMVDLIGHQFWWEIHYPNQAIVTANEIHVPVGEPVLFRITSADVIHSFWVPQLHGKLDLIPGDTNHIWLQAEQPGVYRGICAEFCGTQHALMHLLIIAQPADEFAAWVTQQQQPVPVLTDPVLIHGQQVFMGSACVYCHTIQGLNQAAATDTIGPDLTHLASRQTLAAGVVENNRANLGGWILDPHGIKPGNRMPPTRINSTDFQALLTYLESLR